MTETNPAPGCSRGTESTTSSQDKSNGKPSAAAVQVAQLQRRRSAAARIVGGDPTSPVELALGRPPYDPERIESLSDRDLAAWADAALFLEGHGYAPIVPLVVCRALWRRGDRDLGTQLARLRGCEI